MPDDRKTYEVLEDGFIDGDYYRRGETAAFKPGAVKYLAQPYGQRLKEVAAAKKPAKKPAATDDKAGA